MTIYEIASDGIRPVTATRFGDQGIKERGDLQRLLRTRIDVVAPGTMVIAEEFGSFEESQRRIDLLAIDKDASLVVIELKRTQTGGHMELQAVRYAAMVSAMTFDQAVEAHEKYLQALHLEGDARQAILDFLEWDEPAEDDFAQDVRVILVAADFSKELTTAVMWLNERDLDIRCVRLKPYALDGRVLMDVQQVIPLPEAAEYQVKVREKARKERKDRLDTRDLTKYDVTVNGHTQARQAKRRTVFLVVSGLCEAGVTPEQIHKTLAWRAGNLWRCVDGKVDSGQFARAATAAARNGGPAFDPRRWYHDDEDLIVSGGKTWALSKMWGGATERALKELLAAHPGHDISYRAAEDDL